jgi:asparagine synthase (glutamine-hydrolysing)
MCGFVGFLDLHRRWRDPELQALAAAMVGRLQSRGPDDAGVWSDASAGIALGHRRLSIIDLSPAGHQPMVSASGRFVIAFNGEIYNFLEIRSRLLEEEPVVFRGHSDTEVLLAACERWGLDRTLLQINGMFAFALWDREQRVLTLARDHMGIKPLYWGRCGETIYFGSQPKAFAGHSDWTGKVDRDALDLYTRLGYVPAPHSIFSGIEKLEPGHMAVIGEGGTSHKVVYWDLSKVAARAAADPVDCSEAEAVEDLDRLLRAAVGRQMVSDVPLGAFLSGGIDSSVVAALMQDQSRKKVRTFSIGFGDPAYDEAPHAKAVATHLGTDHSEYYVGAQELVSGVWKVPEIYDEPFGDSSQLPTAILCAAARRQVTVALSGDGGDELFAGYGRYFRALELKAATRGMPPIARSLAGKILLGVPQAAWNRIFGLIPARWRPARAGARLHALGGHLGQSDEGGLYRGLICHWPDASRIAKGAGAPRGVLWDGAAKRAIPGFLEWMQFCDSLTYLPEDILAKVDRASMAVSLEVRVPLLDHRVVEHSWRLPAALKVRNGSGKWLLRQVLAKYVPPSLTERPKMGFGVPLEKLLRNELRDWAESLLDARKMNEQGYLDPQPIRARWEEHLSGQRDWQYSLWPILMFQAWLESTAGNDSRS